MLKETVITSKLTSIIMLELVKRNSFFLKAPAKGALSEENKVDVSEKLIKKSVLLKERPKSLLCSLKSFNLISSESSFEYSKSGHNSSNTWKFHRPPRPKSLTDNCIR